MTPLARSHLPSMIWSSMVCASSYNRRAASAVAGLLRMSGNRPRISQVEKNGCQSM
jgi:hypothetical protein